MSILDYFFRKGKKEQERRRKEEEARILKQKEEQMREFYAQQEAIHQEKIEKERKEWLEENHRKATERNARLAELRKRLKEVTKDVDEENEKRRKTQEQRRKEEKERVIEEIERVNQKERERLERERQRRIQENKRKKEKERANNSSTNKLIEDNRTHFYELDDIKYRSMGSDLMLAPYDFQCYMQFPDAKLLPALANTEKIQRFLPYLGFSNEEATKKRLEGYLYKTEHQLGVTYVIRIKNIPIGMVFVNTPLYNKKTINKAIWTIDFFISEHFEHKGIVYNAVLRVLNEMKNAMGAKVVYALVDQDNYDCIRLIGKGLFSKIDVEGFNNKDGGQPPFVYMIDIAHMNFIKR